MVVKVLQREEKVESMVQDLRSCDRPSRTVQSEHTHHPEMKLTESDPQKPTHKPSLTPTPSAKAHADCLTFSTLAQLIFPPLTATICLTSLGSKYGVKLFKTESGTGGEGGWVPFAFAFEGTCCG